MKFLSLFLSSILLSISIPNTVSAQSTFYQEDFGDPTTGTIPIDWLVPTGAWELSTSVVSPGSGGNNLENKGNAPGYLISPSFDFSAVTSGQLSYLARRTATYDSLNLQIEASINSGVNWDIVVIDSMSALPGEASTYETITGAIPQSVLGESAVQFRFNARAATGGNLRIDDVRLDVTGLVDWNRIGFGTDTTEAVGGTDSLIVPIMVHLVPASENLQALQFEIQLTAGLQLAQISRGVGLAGSKWQFSEVSTDSSAHVVAIADDIVGLGPPGSDTLVVLNIRVTPNQGIETRIDSLSIHELIVSASSDVGDDLQIDLMRIHHIVATAVQAPILTIDSTRLDFGILPADTSVTRTITLENEGSVELVVNDMYSVSGKLQISPIIADLPAGASSPTTLTLQGSQYGPGNVLDWLIIDHNGESSPDTVEIVAVFVSGQTRGDVNDDGYVDVVDLVYGIDLILGNVQPDENADRIDLHPFPDGNASIDVRDLTVLARAITQGIWPDDVALVPAPMNAAKTDVVVGDFVLRETDSGTELWVRSTVDLRALHVILRNQDASPLNLLPVGKEVLVSNPYRPAGAGSLSILAFQLDSAIVVRGVPLHIGTLAGVGASDLQLLKSAVVIDERDLARLARVNEFDTMADGFDRTHYRPYPNPVPRSSIRLLHIPVYTPERISVGIEVADILGRIVSRELLTDAKGLNIIQWDLRGPSGSIVPSGIYFVRITTGDGLTTHKVVVR